MVCQRRYLRDLLFQTFKRFRVFFGPIPHRIFFVLLPQNVRFGWKVYDLFRPILYCSQEGL